ncbi:hypothetical protein D9M68_998880 [compost metagenome]
MCLPGRWRGNQSVRFTDSKGMLRHEREHAERCDHHDQADRIHPRVILTSQFARETNDRRCSETT